MYEGQTDSSKLDIGMVESISDVQLEQQVRRTPDIIRNLNSVSDFSHLTICGTHQLQAEVVRVIGELPAIDRLGIHCPAQAGSFDTLPRATRERIIHLSLRNESAKHPITDAMVSSAARIHQYRIPRIGFCEIGN